MHTIIWELTEASGKKSYANLFSHYFNKTAAKIIIQFLIFAQFCSLILYTAVSWSFLAHLLKIVGLIDFPIKDENTQEIDQNDPLTIKWRYICMAAMCLFIYPINCTKNLAALRYISMAILIIVFYTIVVALVQTPDYYDHNHTKPTYEVNWVVGTFSMKWFQGWATMMLSYNCQITLFYVRGELMHKTHKRTRKVSRLLIGILYPFYSLIAITGYISMGGKDIPAVYTLRKPYGSPSTNQDSSNRDIPMKIAQCLFLFAALFHIPLTLYPSREQIYIFYQLKKDAKIHLPLTGIMTVLAFLIPCIYPDVTNILGLLGGLTVGSSGYLLPTILKITSLSSRPWYDLNRLGHILLAMGIFTLQCTSIYTSLSG